MKKIQEDIHISNRKENRQSVKHFNYQNDIYPIHNRTFGSQNRGFSSYSISALDASKITFGILFIIVGISFIIFGFIIYLLFSPFGLMITIFPGLIPIFIVYNLLNRFMGSWDMIKAATITTFLAGLIIYILGLLIFLSFLGGM
ncbi:MAG: hypothetical protein HeimC2_30860 [Candidatus Heimdallarchaeota archaeon LC_2]|nr:MAG: hypothetical protein HeimC2_30860 [Candidatus Heimdallarchaeota archaeon LC_2]